MADDLGYRLGGRWRGWRGLRGHRCRRRGRWRRRNWCPVGCPAYPDGAPRLVKLLDQQRLRRWIRLAWPPRHGCRCRGPDHDWGNNCDCQPLARTFARSLVTSAGRLRVSVLPVMARRPVHASAPVTACCQLHTAFVVTIWLRPAGSTEPYKTGNVHIRPTGHRCDVSYLGGVLERLRAIVMIVCGQTDRTRRHHAACFADLATKDHGGAAGRRCDEDVAEFWRLCMRGQFLVVG
jgi:hypothetical protein